MTPRIYLIGTGVIAHHHAQARAQIPDCELHAADPSPDARASFQEAFPDAVMYESSAEMLKSPPQQEDLVVVATPPRWHVSEGLKALESGRSVLVEKPLAMHADEAESLWASARAKGLHLAVCGSRFQSWTLNRRVRELIREGALGEVYLVDWMHRSLCQRTGIEYQNGSWWFLDKGQSGGGPLMDWGPYDFNVLLSILEPESVTVDHAVCSHPDIPEPIPADAVYNTETQAVAALTFVCGGKKVRIRFERTCATHGQALQTEGIYGTKGVVSWNWLPFGDDLNLQIHRTTGPDSVEVETISADAGEAPNWMFEPVLQFRNYLRGEEAIGMFDENALHAFRLIQAVYESAETGRAVTITL